MLFDIDAKDIIAPKQLYTSISDATEAEGASHTPDLDALHSLYLIKFYNNVKIGGTNDP